MNDEQYKKNLIERCENYCSDDDFSGEIGHSLADELVKAFPEKYNHPLISEETSQGEWKKYYEVIEKERIRLNVPFGLRQRIKGVLGRLKKAGMKMTNYSSMRTPQMWNYFCKIKKEIRSHVL